MPIYLDHAASTPMRPEAIEAMLPFLAEHPGNPSGSHAASRATKTALEIAREQVADAFGARPDEIVFTGGGSEGDNLAVKGAAWMRRTEGGRVVASGIEHKAVLGAVERLGREGFDTAVVGAHASGVVDLDRLRDAVDERTVVVSVMTVNNETGVVQPLDAIAEIVRDRAPRAVFHTDAVQAPQWLDLRAATRACDLVAVSGHKFGGPKGVGALVRRAGGPLVPLIEGGGHEYGMRAGTQNVAGIVAFATALTATDTGRAAEVVRIAALRDRFVAGLEATIGGVTRNGADDVRVAGLAHLAIDGIDAETLLVALDQAGVCAASGSACSSGAIDPSHVLVAMGMPRARALSSVRFSFGWASTDADVDAALAVVPEVVQQLRARGV